MYGMQNWPKKKEKEKKKMLFQIDQVSDWTGKKKNFCDKLGKKRIKELENSG